MRVALYQGTMVNDRIIQAILSCCLVTYFGICPTLVHAGPPVGNIQGIYNDTLDSKSGEGLQRFDPTQFESFKTDFQKILKFVDKISPNLANEIRNFYSRRDSQKVTWWYDARKIKHCPKTNAMMDDDTAVQYACQDLGTHRVTVDPRWLKEVQPDPRFPNMPKSQEVMTLAEKQCYMFLHEALQNIALNNHIGVSSYYAVFNDFKQPNTVDPKQIKEDMIANGFGMYLINSQAPTNAGAKKDQAQNKSNPCSYVASEFQETVSAFEKKKATVTEVTNSLLAAETQQHPAHPGFAVGTQDGWNRCYIADDKGHLLNTSPVADSFCTTQYLVGGTDGWNRCYAADDKGRLLNTSPVADSLCTTQYLIGGVNGWKRCYAADDKGQLLNISPVADVKCQSHAVGTN